MFYFVIFNSSISKSPNPNKRILTTLLYGTVAYICFHAILSSSKNDFLNIIQQYFWIFIVSDFASSIYMYNEYCEQRRFNNNILSQIMKVVTTILDGILGSKISGISYGLEDDDNYDNSDADSDADSDDYNSDDSNDNGNNSKKYKNKEHFKNKKTSRHKKGYKRSKGILKNKVSFNNESEVKHFNKDEIISTEQQLNNTQSEMSELNKQLMALQQQQEQSSQPKMGTSISAIRNKQITPSQQQEILNQTQSKMPSLPTNEINNMLSNTDELLKNKTNIKTEDLANIKMNYEPNVDLTNNNTNNLQLDNFIDNPMTELNKDNTNEVNELFKSYSNNLSNTNTDVKENFQQQMDQFNKQKEELLKKQLSSKNVHQNKYSPNIETASAISSSSDLGSVMDFDMDDFANTL